MRPAPVGHNHERKIFRHKDLSTCTHVFLCVGAAKDALSRPYFSPHKIINRRSDSVYEIDNNGTNKNVSVENCKPSFFLDKDVESTMRTTVEICNDFSLYAGNKIDKNKIVTPSVAKDKNEIVTLPA